LDAELEKIDKYLNDEKKKAVRAECSRLIAIARQAFIGIINSPKGSALSGELGEFAPFGSENFATEMKNAFMVDPSNATLCIHQSWAVRAGLFVRLI